MPKVSNNGHVRLTTVSLHVRLPLSAASRVRREADKEHRTANAHVYKLMEEAWGTRDRSKSGDSVSK